jgi:AbiU2
VSTTPLRQKWHQDLITLGNEVFTLHMYRQFWRDFVRTAEAAGVMPGPPGHIFAFFAGCYSTRQAVAIRRLCMSDRREYSFHHFLTEVRNNPGLTEQPTTASDIDKDILSLNAGNLKSVRSYVNQRVAHRQQKPVATIPTFADIHAAIDDLGSLLQKYMRIVEDVHQELEAIVDEDVMGPFRKAWLPPLPR